MFVYREGEWIETTVNALTFDEELRSIYRQILERTIGAAADDVTFVYESYYSPDGVGRPEKAAVVGRWLCLEARTDRSVLSEDGMARFLRSASLDELWSHAARRGDALGRDGLYPEMPGDEVAVADFSDGHRIVELKTPEAIANESQRSGIGQPRHPDRSETFVLRDGEGETVAMLVATGRVVGMLAPSGRRVPFHVSRAYLVDFIRTRGFALREPTEIHGAVQTADGEIYDLRDLPAGSTIDGNFWIRDEGHLLSRLPDDLTVNGDFGLYRSTFLRATPRNMRVSGDCGYASCPGLRVISEGTRVGGRMHLDTCGRIETIEPGTRFEGGVSLSAAIDAVHAPEGFADAVDIRGDGIRVTISSDRFRSDEAGGVIIDRNLIAKAIGRQAAKDIARFVTLEIAYNVSSAIRRGTRALKRSMTARHDPPPPAPKP